MDFINNLIVKAQATVTAREEGQAMVEYGLILVIVSVAALVTLGTVAGGLDATFSNVATHLGYTTTP